MTDKTVYTVGYNVPGYLPTMDPHVCGTWAEATAAMVDELRRHADDFLASGPEDSDVDDMVALDYAANTLETIVGGRYWSVTIGGVEYWIHPETEQRIVYVVSFAPTGDERAIGGFDWYPVQWGQVAAMRFHRDVQAEKAAGWSGIRYRLLRLSVPAILDGQELTDYLDNDIDYLEVIAPAILDVTL